MLFCHLNELRIHKIYSETRKVSNWLRKRRRGEELLWNNKIESEQSNAEELNSKEKWNLQMGKEAHTESLCLLCEKSGKNSRKTIINHQITVVLLNLYSLHISQNGESTMVYNRGLKCFIQRQLDTVSSSGSEAIPGKYFSFFVLFSCLLFLRSTINPISCWGQEEDESIEVPWAIREYWCGFQ